MKKFLVGLVLLASSLLANAEIVTLPIPGAPGLSVTVGTGVNALPLQDIRTNPNAVNITTWDDNITEVPLGFNFPFFGRTFTNSWAATNGFVTFQDPWQSGLGGGCCSGVDLRNTTHPAYNYTIFGVHTDLYSWNGQNQYYLREPNQMTYGWYNVSQCCSSQGGNNFEIKINSSGGVDTRIAGAMVQWNAVTSGMSGDLSRGEYFQYYHGSGWQVNSSTGAVSWNTNGGFTGADLCTTNPLSSPSCPGYFTAQCTVSALYNPSCPGYAGAYYTQQCSLNSLYDVNCPGYAAAYLSYQCSQNPLYSTTCEGYEQAYFNQQCSTNPLYSTNCPGYAEAYRTQQCSLNPLYSTTCSGYADAYFSQQCSISGLYSTTCPNYQQAYFSQQCSLNGLYSTRCPNYATAYATQQALLASQQTPTTTTTTTSTVATTPSAPTADSSGEIKVAVVADQNVNNVITTTATSASPAAAATATVPLVSTTNTAAETKVAAVVETKAETKEEKKDASSNSVSSTSTASTSTSTDTKPAAPTARQELQARREAAAKAKAVEDGKNLASNMGKVADMESQKQVQNVVIQAMGFTPGFDAYGRMMIPQTLGYKPYTVYNNQVNVDNRRLGRGLYGPSDALHNDLVDLQYRGN